VHPDVISYGSIVASLIAAAMFLFSMRWPWLLLVAPLFCFLRLWLNMLDGMVALASGKASRRGELLNELPDRASDVVVFAGVAHSGWCHEPLAYWAAILAVLTAYVGVFGQAVGGKREYGGIMAKPWRMVVLAIASYATFFSHITVAVIGSLTIFDLACIVVIAGCVQTIWVRLASILRNLGRSS
jgi:phosphatidylglycerophosphate synthase